MAEASSCVSHSLMTGFSVCVRAFACMHVCRLCRRLLQADNYTSIGVFDPELNPEQGRLAWSLIIVFTASVFVFITAYNLARSHAAYWLTMQPRREEFKQIVDARMLEREAEWTGILAWVAQKNSGKGAVLVHVIIATVRSPPFTAGRMPQRRPSVLPACLSAAAYLLLSRCRGLLMPRHMGAACLLACLLCMYAGDRKHISWHLHPCVGWHLPPSMTNDRVQHVIMS
jgi:hypothetical protein